MSVRAQNENIFATIAQIDDVDGIFAVRAKMSVARHVYDTLCKNTDLLIYLMVFSVYQPDFCGLSSVKDKIRPNIEIILDGLPAFILHHNPSIRRIAFNNNPTRHCSCKREGVNHDGIGPLIAKVEDDRLGYRTNIAQVWRDEATVSQLSVMEGD